MFDIRCSVQCCAPLSELQRTRPNGTHESPAEKNPPTADVVPNVASFGFDRAIEYDLRQSRIVEDSRTSRGHFYQPHIYLPPVKRYCEDQLETELEHKRIVKESATVLVRRLLYQRIHTVQGQSKEAEDEDATPLRPPSSKLKLREGRCEGTTESNPNTSSWIASAMFMVTACGKAIDRACFKIIC